MKSAQRHIKLLPEGLQNQIAAGEVVERPASVIKELIENSLDANSTAIHITVEDGGQTSIVIRDNGHGIPLEEIPLALTRHATSKLRSFLELTHIASYGFRGEALPSIASVSLFRLESAFQKATDGQPQGYFIESDYGTITKEGPSSLYEGTQITIRDLFANVPARLKFLKTPATELRRCQDIVTRLALAQPQCTFSFTSGTREVFTMPASMSLKERLACIWPASVIESLLPIDTLHHNIHVTGFTSAPHSVQGKSDRLLLYVNNRPVTDKLMISAVRQAYKGKLTSREYPQGAIFVTIDPSEIDVNVHPAKTEIRFRDEPALFSAIMRSIGNTFAQNAVFTNLNDEELTSPPSPTSRPLGFWGSIDSPPLVPQREGGQMVPTTITDTSETPHWATPHTGHAPTYAVQEPYSTAYKHTPESAPIPSQMAGIGTNAPSGAEPFTASTYQESSSAFGHIATMSPHDMANSAPTPHSASTAWHQAQSAQHQAQDAHSQGSQTPSTQPYVEFLSQDSLRTPVIQPLQSGYPIQVGDIVCLGQVATTYLILVQQDELLLLDQHAAHERVLLAGISSSNNAGRCQLLALPEQIPLHESELEQYEQCASKLTQMGYKTELADDTLMVSGLPPLLSRGKALQLLRDILEDKTEGFDDIFHMMACRSALKAGHVLTADEAATLLQQWLCTPENMHCPHGRPIVLRFGKKEFEKLFKRTVG